VDKIRSRLINWTGSDCLPALVPWEGRKGCGARHKRTLVEVNLLKLDSGASAMPSLEGKGGGGAGDEQLSHGLIFFFFFSLLLLFFKVFEYCGEMVYTCE